MLVKGTRVKYNGPRKTARSRYGGRYFIDPGIEGEMVPGRSVTTAGGVKLVLVIVLHPEMVDYPLTFWIEEKFLTKLSDKA